MRGASVAVPIVVACGRGRDISAPIIRDYIVQKARQRLGGNPNNEQPKLLYLGTPDYESQEGLDLQLKGYKKSCSIEHLKLTNIESLPSFDEIQDSIQAADIIAVSGGNTLFAMNRWKRLGIDILLKEAYMRGTVMCGGSAGAICWFDGGHSDSLDPATVLNQKDNLTEAEKSDWNYVRIAGLGLIPALCCPHHDQIQSNGVKRADDFDAMLLRNPGEIGICIDNNAAFVLEGDQWFTLSTGPWEHAEKGGNVQRKVFDNGSIVSTTLDCNVMQSQPLSELLTPPDFTHLPWIEEWS